MSTSVTVPALFVKGNLLTAAFFATSGSVLRSLIKIKSSVAIVTAGRLVDRQRRDQHRQRAGDGDAQRIARSVEWDGIINPGEARLGVVRHGQSGLG